MKGLLGEKIGMSQVYDVEGRAVPVTLVRATTNVVLAVRDRQKDGYTAVQLGFGDRKPRRIAKPQRGHFKDFGNFRSVQEFRISEDDASDLPGVGDRLDVSMWKEGDRVIVRGISKAKGFQGVVKRHGFHGAPATHGTKHAHREPGSIGGAGGRAGGRVAKGMRMAGRMGGDRVTVRNITVAKVDTAAALIALKGAIPGRRGTLIAIRGM